MSPIARHAVTVVVVVFDWATRKAAFNQFANGATTTMTTRKRRGISLATLATFIGFVKIEGEIKKGGKTSCHMNMNKYAHEMPTKYAPNTPKIPCDLCHGHN